MSEWIKVEDRLPEVGQTVILFEGKGDWYQCWFGNVTSGGHIQYYKGDSCLFDKTFTHWMLLPDPPKE